MPASSMTRSVCAGADRRSSAGADTKWQYLPDGQCVGIPFRTLMAAGAENVLVAVVLLGDARCPCSVRSMAQCMGWAKPPALRGDGQRARDFRFVISRSPNCAIISSAMERSLNYQRNQP